MQCRACSVYIHVGNSRIDHSFAPKTLFFIEENKSVSVYLSTNTWNHLKKNPWYPTPAHRQTLSLSDTHSLVRIRAGACALVVFGTVDVWAVVEGSVPPADGSAAPLVQEVPMEAGKGSVLGTLVLHEQRTLFCPELLQIPAWRGAEREREVVGDDWLMTSVLVYVLYLTPNDNYSKLQES